MNHRLDRRGLSLLEVILALAILALCLSAIGELIRIGTISAANAEDYTEAQILAESKLSEIMSGAITPDPVTRVPFINSPDWVYSIELAATEEPEVMAMRVTVETHLDRARPLAYSLYRWIPDPGIELPAEEEQPDNSSQNTDNSSQDSPDTPTGSGGTSGGNNSNSGGMSGGNIPSNIPGGGNLPGGFVNPSTNGQRPGGGR
jgi:prepilin-type N-terminal cleavage/methylation domain-containing protein